MAPSLRKMLGGIALNTARPEDDADPRSAQFAVPQPTPPEPSSIYERDPILDQHARERAASASSATSSNCRPSVKYVQAQGCDFAMATNAPNGADMPLSGNPPHTDGPSERLLRSSSRRQERADSHQDDVNESKARDFATAPRDGLHVPHLNIRKHLETPTHIPSPRSSPLSPSESLSVPPQPAENERKRDMEQAYTTSPELIKDERWDAPSPKAVRTLGLGLQQVNQPVSPPVKDQKRAIPAGRYEKALPPVLTPGAPDTIKGAVVRPPFYDAMKHATLQWASPGITNSRPAGPWEPCPRWSCCKCNADTIVEQVVCANLECGHSRCPVRCQVRVAHRDRSLFR